MLAHSNIDYLQTDVLKLCDNLKLWSLEHSDHFESEEKFDIDHFKNNIVVPVCRECSLSQLQEMKEVLEHLNMLLNDENVPIKKRQLWFACISDDFKSMSCQKFNVTLNQLLSIIYDGYLYEAMDSKNIEKVKSILQLKWIDNKQKSSLLYSACYEGMEEIVKIVLELPGVNVNYRDNLGITPLWTAVNMRHLNIVRLLKIAPHLDPNIPQRFDLRTPLYVAADRGDIHIMKELLGIKGIKVDLADECKKTPLYMAAENKDIDIVQQLLNAKADPRLVAIKQSENHDINSLLKQSLQRCLIKSMQALGYASNDGGVCYPFSMVILQAALCGKKALNQLFQLFFKIRQLRLNEYKLCLMQNNITPKPGELHVKKVNDFIEYRVISPSGKDIKDKLEIKDLAEPFTIETLQPYLPKILSLTTEKGHTKLSDLKTMQIEHDQYINRAEQEALQEMKCKDIHDLTEEEQITFRKLALKMTKTIRELLSNKQKEKDELYIQIRALFDSMEILRKNEKYPQLFPFKHPHIGDKQTDQVAFQMVKPASLKKECEELLIKQFSGAYYGKELVAYFKELRSLLKDNTSITDPVVLLLSSPDHVVAVIYDPKMDAWQLCDANQFSRTEQELTDFTFQDDAIIAAQVAASFFPGKTNAIFETQLYGNNKNTLISIIDTWYEKLKPYHEITTEKAEMLVLNNGSYLYLAATSADTCTIRALLKAGTNVNQVSCYETLPISMAIQNGSLETVRSFLDSEQKMELNLQNETNEQTPLYKAVTMEKADIVQALLTTKNVVSEVNPNVTTSEDGWTSLHCAAFMGYTAIVKILLEAKLPTHTVDVDPVALDGATPLFCAAQEGHADIVELLLKTGKVDPNKAMIKCGSTPLLIAIEKKRFDIIKMLLQSDKVNPDLPDKEGVTPLMLAAESGDVETVKLLLNTGKVDINKPSPTNGNTPLFCAMEAKKWDVVKILLQSNKINLNVLNHEGFSPLMKAIVLNHKETINAILEPEKAAMVDVNLTSPLGSALHCAAYIKQADIVNQLLEYHANQHIVDRNGNTPLYIASTQHDIACVKALLNNDKIDLCGSESASPLFIAAQEGFSEITQVLLHAKANPNFARESDGATPLYMAAQLGHYDTVKYLLDAGADPNITLFMDGDTPKSYRNSEFPPSVLEIAVKMGHSEVVKLLEAHKAKPFSKTGLAVNLNSGHLFFSAPDVSVLPDSQSRVVLHCC